MPTKTLIYSLVCSRFNSLVCSKLMFEGHKHRCECHYPDSVCEVDDADCLQAQQAVSVHIPTKQNEQCSHTHQAEWTVFTYPPSRMNSVHIPTKQNEQCSHTHQAEWTVFTYPPSRMNSVHIPTKQNEQCRCKMDLCLMPYNFELKCVGEEFAAGYWDWDGVRKGIWNCGKYMTQIQCLFHLAMLPDEKTDENTITWLV